MSAPPSSVQTVTRNFLKLGLGELAARVIAFLTMVYIARHLGAEAYGIVGFAYAAILYFVGIADFGIEALGPREIAEAPDRVRSLAPAILIARLMLAASLALVVALVGGLVLPYPDGLVLALYGLTLLATGGGTRWIYLGLERAGRVAIARTVGEVVRALLILLLVHEAIDVVKVPIAHVVGETLAAVLLIAWLRRHGLAWHRPIDLSIVWPVFRRSWPLAATMLLGMVIYNSDLIFLRYFRDAEEVGYYLAAFTLITLLGNLGNSYSSSLLPTLTRAGQTSAQHRLYHTAMAHVIVIALPIAAGGYLLASQIIVFFFGVPYEASAAVLQVLIVSVPLVLIRGVLRAALITAGRQDRLMWIALWAAILSIGLNLLVIPRYGMIGAAITTVAIEVVRTLLTQFYVWVTGFPITGFGRYWRSVIATLVMGGVLWTVGPSSLWTALLLGVFVYVLALILSGGIRLKRGKFPVLNV